MVMKDNAIVQLDVDRKLKRRTKVVNIEGTIESMEAEQAPCADLIQAEIILAQKGCNMNDMTRGDMLLEAANLGLINVLKAVENQ